MLGAAGLAGVEVGAVDLLLADGAADEDREDDEAEPSPDRDLAVGGAPVGRSCCQVALRGDEPTLRPISQKASGGGAGA